MSVPLLLKRLVRLRAGKRCEYCGLSQSSQEAAFHIDHIIPRAQGGPTTAGNLALACVSCSLRKGAKATAVDPLGRGEVRIFNPRMDAWRLHFRWNGTRLVGLSAIGRATIHALRINRASVLAIRAEEAFRGRHPPPGQL